MGFLYYLLRKKGVYHPRDGWKLFSYRLLFANVLLAIGLWVGAGDMQMWLTQGSAWRCIHLAVILVSAMVIYFLGLVLAGVRPRHLLIPHRQLA
jgi:putative peptidoglycan lipid II flippase